MSAISVFGLGYVGAVSLACLAESGHTMMGVDVNPTKVALIAEGCSPIIEAGLEESLKKGVLSGRIQATTDTGGAGGTAEAHDLRTSLAAAMAAL